MADNGVEQNKGGESSSEKQIQEKLNSQTAEQLKAEMEKLKDNAQAAKVAIEVALHNRESPNPQYYFQGSKEDKDSPKGKITTLKEFIQTIFQAAKTAPEKVPATSREAQKDQETPQLNVKSVDLIKKLGEKISVDDVQNDDRSAPYIFEILQGITNGTIKSSEDLSRKMMELGQTLQYTSPGMLTKLQNAGVEYAVQTGHEEKEAKRMFGVQEYAQNSPEQMKQEQLAAEELQAKRTVEESWRVFSGFFDEDKDRKLIEALYTPTRFIDYCKKMSEELQTNYPELTGDKLAQKLSSELEIKTTLLFGKLYSKLDHEKPSEFFEHIEQEDIMKGITPAKTELKRRLERLASDLHHVHVPEELKFFRKLEARPEINNIDVGKGKVKPRTRLFQELVPKESNAGEFIHYLDQIADHYIDARRYTHNARALLLNPSGDGKGFYNGLAQYASKMSTLDFDQMMMLPDNDVFLNAYGLYMKMLSEGFAKNDWRHDAHMFTSKPNQHLTQIEEDVLHQLQAMYADRTEITDSRLEAALTMAVGASRGMFLTEQEMCADADPHLDEKGGSTFVSYYHQDATALMAFNPQHLLARFAGGPNLLDPIFFMPVAGFEGSQGFNDHRQLWDKAKKYKASFLEGRGPLPEQTFFDKMKNIGLIGGPMQRKGWRTSWQFDSLYINDKVKIKDFKGVERVADKINYIKSFTYFENIGYEMLQDFVGKIDGSFAQVRDTHGLSGDAKRMMDQKKELFKYVYNKYFEADEKGLNKHLDGIRKAQRDKLMKSIRKGIAAPDDIDAEVEGMTTKAFLDQMLSRVITQRIPSKILLMDRDRYAKDGVSRYRKIMQQMGLEDTPGKFDAVMKDMILAEQMMRKNVSLKMKELRAQGVPNEKLGEIAYKMTPDTIRAMLEPLIAQKHMTPERINEVLRMYGLIKQNYLNDKFIDEELVDYFKHGGAQERKSKFTIALEETDMSFIPFRAGGESVLKRAVGDVAGVEEGVVKPVLELVKKLRDMAINGKKDFGPIVEIIGKVYSTLDGIIGTGYANELACDIAAMTVMYMKKDTAARALMGLGGAGRFNSMAAESAGKRVGVWEWDSADIDRFFFALEARGVVNSTPYNIAQEPGKEPLYVNIPFKKEPVKLPDTIHTSKIAELFGGKDGKFMLFGKEITIPDIPLFTRQRHDFGAWSKQLREKFGGTKMDMFFDIMNKYLPFVALFILWSIIKKAFDDAEGKKK